MEEEKKIVFAEIEQTEAYELCSRLGIRMLPLVQIYQGSRGKVEEFGWGPAQVGELRKRAVKYCGGSTLE